SKTQGTCGAVGRNRSPSSATARDCRTQPAAHRPSTRNVTSGVQAARCVVARLRRRPVTRRNRRDPGAEDSQHQTNFVSRPPKAREAASGEERMNTPECRREQEVVEAVLSGQWPDSSDMDLRSHVEVCAICKDVVAVAHALNQDSKPAVEGIRLPSAGLVWW